MSGLRRFWRTPFSPLRTKRIIVKNFFLLALVSLLSAAMFYFFVDSIYRRSTERNLHASNMHILTRLGDTMDIYFSSLGQMMEIAMRNRDFISATVRPNPDHYERNKSLLTYLATLAKGNELIKDAFYYIGETDYVYSSQGNMTPLRKFAFNTSVEEILRDKPEKSEPLLKMPELRMVHSFGEIFLFRDFFTVNRLGTMFFRIDADALYSLINGKGPEDGDGSIYTYDSNLRPLLAGQGYPSMTAETISTTIAKSGGKPITLHGLSYYHYLDPNTRWMYLLAFPADYSFGQKIALRLIIPFLFFFLVINLAVFLYSTLSVYRPVNEIIRSIRSSEDDTPSSAVPDSARNEFDFIKRAFAHMAGENEQYEALLQKFAPGAQERLFNMLISRRELPPGHVLEVLNGVHSPLAKDDQFMAVVFRLETSQGQKSELEADVVKLYIQEALADVLPNDLHRFWFLGKNDDIVVVAGFLAERSRFLTAQFLAAVDLCAKECAGKNAWTLFWGYGDPCDNIVDIAYSYGEAVKMLRIKQYTDTGSQTQEEKEALALNVSGEAIMEKRVDAVWQHIMDKNVPQAETTALRMIEELESNRPETTPEDAPDGGNGFALLTNIFIKRLVDMQISPEDLMETERMMARPATGKPDAACTREFVLHCVAMLDTYNRKRQNKYILGALAYIAEHYSDSDLSLNSVSEYLGIHSSYLSRLFNETRQTSFTVVLSEYRIEMARQLLQLTTQSVADIGFKTGFNSAQNFIRVFKKYTGITPGQFRGQQD